jgi:hypothetical protein
MDPERIAYGGWAHCLRLSNGTIEVVVTLDVGPRVIRLGFTDGQNLFQNFEEELGLTGGSAWRSYGGHRLWHSPEVVPRTYFPDNQPVTHAWDGQKLTLTPAEESENRVQLSMEIQLHPSEPIVTVDHRIRNTGVWDVELAPWGLSVMANGGRAVFPQERFIPHPDVLLPARPLVLWHFTRMADPRWRWGDRYIQLREDASVESKQKVGARNTHGWAAYLLNGEAFIKRFGHDPKATYPDFGCNCEFYTEPGFLEIESLGPMTRLPPGDSLCHRENWGLFRAKAGDGEDILDETLLPLVERVPAVSVCS